jgi:hypothetical protein
MNNYFSAAMTGSLTAIPHLQRRVLRLPEVPPADVLTRLRRQIKYGMYRRENGLHFAAVTRRKNASIKLARF